MIQCSKKKIKYNTYNFSTLILLCEIPQAHNYYNDKIVKLFKLSVTESSLAQRDELYEINYLIVHYNKILHCNIHTYTCIYIYTYIYIYYDCPYYTNTLNRLNVSVDEHVL